MTCCAIGCRSRSGEGKKLFAIPTGERNAARRKEWLRRIRRANFKPASTARLCEDHFTIDQYERIALERYGIKKLRRDAVPTIFSYNTKPGRFTKKVLAKGNIRTTKNSCLFKPIQPRPSAVKPLEDKVSLTTLHLHELELDPPAARCPGNLQGNGLSHQDSICVAPEELMVVETGLAGDVQSSVSSESEERSNLVIVSVRGAVQHETTEDRELAPLAESVGGHTYCHSLGTVQRSDQRKAGAVERVAVVAGSPSSVLHQQSADCANILPSSQPVLRTGGGKELPNGFSSHLGGGRVVLTSSADECQPDAGPRDVSTQLDIGSASSLGGNFDRTFPTADDQHEADPKDLLSHGLVRHRLQAPRCPGAQDGGEERHGKRGASSFANWPEGENRPKQASTDVMLPCPLVPAEQCEGTAQTARSVLANGHDEQASVHHGSTIGRNWHAAAGMGDTQVVTTTNSFASCSQNSLVGACAGRTHRPEVAPPPDAGVEPTVGGPYCGSLRTVSESTPQHGDGLERVGGKPAELSALGTTFSPLSALERVVTVNAGALAAMLERRPLRTEEDLRERIGDLEEKLLRAQRRLAISRARGHRVELENRALRAQVHRLLRAPAIRYARHRRRGRPPSPGGAAPSTAPS